MEIRDSAVATAQPLTSNGLATLGPQAVAVRNALEQRFLRWAADCAAEQAIYPPLMRVEDLSRLDYFRNFPHLGVLASGIAADAIDGNYAGDADPELESVPAGHVEPCRYALPSAACFNVYLALAGSTLEHPYRVTTAANCFRREDHYDGHRLLGFHMREIVCVGEREAVLDHLAAFKKRIVEYTEAIGLPVSLEPSSDPFFDSSGSRALVAQLFPTKEEVVHRDGGREVAIGSLNFHRNFFGERCGIHLPDGSAAFSGCIAFGIERWIAVLAEVFGESGDALRDRIASA